MIVKVLALVNAVIFIVVVPYLEVSSTHVFSDHWPGHARLHDVWQLMCNGTFSLAAVVLAFSDRRMHWMSATIVGVINITFLVALGLGPQYGGTMQYGDGSELLMADINPAVVVVWVLAAVALAALYQALRDRGIRLEQ